MSRTINHTPSMKPLPDDNFQSLMMKTGLGPSQRVFSLIQPQVYKSHNSSRHKRVHSKMKYESEQKQGHFGNQKHPESSNCK